MFEIILICLDWIINLGIMIRVFIDLIYLKFIFFFKLLY